MKRNSPPPNKIRVIEFFDENKAQRMGFVLKDEGNYFLVKTAMGDKVKVLKNKVASDKFYPRPD